MDIVAWNNIIRDININLDLEGCLKNSIEKVSLVLGVEISSLMLLDKKNQELSIKVAKGLSEEIIKSSNIKVGEGVSGWVAVHKEPLLIKDIREDKRFQKRNGKYHNNSLLSVPLLARDELLGVINVNNKKTKEVFNDGDLEILKEISMHISIAIDKALKYEEVKVLSQLKLDFISVVSHEMRSPLGSIREAINVILDRLAGDVTIEQEKFLIIARNNLDRLLRLINELLDIAKLEVGKLDMKRNFQDICSIVSQVCETLKIDTDKKNIKFKLVRPEGPINMWFDADQVIRVIINIANNAIKFTQDNGMVELRIEDTGKFVQVNVIDNGPGIAKEDLDKIFDKFYSVVNAKLSGIKGTGLGLPIAKEIIELHKGRIWVESEVNRGTKFSFTLPKDIRTI